ncbi:MAG TPA: Cro/CI family transcriptional regulator [Gammaproteobacteria bacterium]|nr:Cro/CI family transcriptional regulator [Gammaproteobacteria bacterium]
MDISQAHRSGKQAAIAAFGGVGKVADALGISSQAVSQWPRIPEDRAIELAREAQRLGLALTLHDMRPDRWDPDATVQMLPGAA